MISFSNVFLLKYINNLRYNLFLKIEQLYIYIWFFSKLINSNLVNYLIAFTPSTITFLFNSYKLWCDFTTITSKKFRLKLKLTFLELTLIKLYQPYFLLLNL